MNTEVSNQWASRWSREPEVRCDRAVLVLREQPTFGTPDSLSRPGHPPMIIGKPRWTVMMALIPHPPTNFSATVPRLFAYFLPLPKGRSRTVARTKRWETSKASRLLSPRRLLTLASFQPTGEASNQLISELVLSMSLETVYEASTCAPAAKRFSTFICMEW